MNWFLRYLFDWLNHIFFTIVSAIITPFVGILNFWRFRPTVEKSKRDAKLGES